MLSGLWVRSAPLPLRQQGRAEGWVQPLPGGTIPSSTKAGDSGARRSPSAMNGAAFAPAVPRQGAARLRQGPARDSTAPLVHPSAAFGRVRGFSRDRLGNSSLSFYPYPLLPSKASHRLDNQTVNYGCVISGGIFVEKKNLGAIKALSSSL